MFYLTYESGSIHKPASRDFELVLKEISSADADRLAAIWTFWEKDSESENDDVTPAPLEQEVHPDQIMF